MWTPTPDRQAQAVLLMVAILGLILLLVGSVAWFGLTGN